MNDIYSKRTNITRVQKKFNLTIELTDGNVYDIYFRCKYEMPEQSAVLKYIYIDEEIGYLPSLVNNMLLYLDIKTNDIVLKKSARGEPDYYEGFEIVTYEMFDGARWSGSFRYAP